ncbi:hypothetical protein FIBSPDRAFT_453608 [Athelia psychrophila]|uniref:Uncharacterized protein n=1 Tax=Athelia psychrophila TaxID=1759441 RepID=A0A166M6S2_9AGAM|nr:hypothetical protein FIBSPDRAFT_453608 [Fibularhizoctonia sp. CBS 109695]
MPPPWRSTRGPLSSSVDMPTCACLTPVCACRTLVRDAASVAPMFRVFYASNWSSILFTLFIRSMLMSCRSCIVSSWPPACNHLNHLIPRETAYL